VKRLPAWLIGMLVLLTALLLWVGIKEREAVGPVPTILAVIWALFILASAPKIFSRDDDH
jgi:hypothetical protein